MKFAPKTPCDYYSGKKSCCCCCCSNAPCCRVIVGRNLLPHLARVCQRPPSLSLLHRAREQRLGNTAARNYRGTKSHPLQQLVLILLRRSRETTRPPVLTKPKYAARPNLSPPYPSALDYPPPPHIGHALSVVNPA